MDLNYTVKALQVVTGSIYAISNATEDQNPV